MNLLIMFTILNVANVIIQTIKSLCTVKCGKEVAALVNAVAYGLYTYVVFYMAADGILLWQKALIIALCNLIGVYVVKWIEERARKDRLWEIKATVYTYQAKELDEMLEYYDLPHSYITISPKHTVFHIYCSTQEQTKKANRIINSYNGKYFISESKSF